MGIKAFGVRLSVSKRLSGSSDNAEIGFLTVAVGDIVCGCELEGTSSCHEDGKGWEVSDHRSRAPLPRAAV